MLITLPSGLAGEIRKIRVSEGKYFTDKALLRSGLTMDRIMAACWVRLADPGVYAFTDSVRWADVLIADRTTCTFYLRIATHGPLLPIDWECSLCEAMNKQELNLVEEVQIKALPDTTKQALRAARDSGSTEPVLFSAGAGKWEMQFRLSYGSDQHRAVDETRRMQTKLQPGEPLNEIAIGLAGRIVSIGGVVGLNSLEQKVLWLEENIDLSEMEQLVEQFDTVDGGVPSSVPARCNTCRAAQPYSIPFDMRLFASPRRTAVAK